MIVKCKGINGRCLTNFTLNNSGDNIETNYPLKMGEKYIVYGQHIYNYVLSYLIIGTFENLPSWYPAELFEVVDSQTYMEWYYQYYENSKLNAIWGYKELVLTDSHYDGLIEREDADIKIFLKRKREIDEFSNLI